MHYSTLLAALPLLSLAAATPAKPATFNLRTKVLEGSKSKDGLHVEPYHTGAGTADAVLVSGKAPQPAFYLNGTQLQYSAQGLSIWTNLESLANYGQWEPVTINSVEGPQYGAFSFSGSKGLVFTTDTKNPKLNEWGGWLACDWYHGSPQLFYTAKYDEANIKLIETCSRVALVKA